ncbi:hypothetical protein I551_8631 [Mycobacterium ulcerans str. Harvey]|uniref:Uncharacterized protein n=1 Tax=Mycobacterium ulcerans str. Harvey TaxID=1299332 RepID=A0ABN0RA98_MYCUL|nr:hypothetical protein I551_8631 [Mycobacterium ulcerans str. Harvey]
MSMRSTIPGTARQRSVDSRLKELSAVAASWWAHTQPSSARLGLRLGRNIPSRSPLLERLACDAHPFEQSSAIASPAPRQPARQCRAAAD